MAYGSGHTMAARAIAEALSSVSPDQEIIHFDAILSSRSPIERFPASFYIFTNKHAHWLWRAFYYWPVFRTRFSDRLTEWLFSQGIRGKIKNLVPDAVVSTHLCSTRASVSLGLPTFVVITDYVYHPFLFSKRATAYFVSSEEIRDALVSQGFPAENIHLTGIPLRSMFWNIPSRVEARATFDLDPNERVVLLMSGNQGVTPVSEIARAFKGSDAFLLAAIGKNERRMKRVESLFREERIKGRVIGFVEDIATLLSACDIIVTKGGGIISSECLAAEIPMVFYDSIPGQEEGNARIISDWGAGVRAKSAGEAARLVLGITGNEAILNRMKEAARARARPHAALDIANLVLKYTGNP